MNMNEVDVMISEEQLQQRVKELGAQITADYEGAVMLLVVGVLRGSFIFMADLVRKIDKVPMQIDFISAASYGAASTTSGQVRIEKDLSEPVEGRDVLIIEDIMDTGLTLNHVVNMIKSRGARSVKVCCLLDKPSRRKVAVELDYIGFSIPDEFVVGYGLDYNNQYRSYPAVCILKREVYERDS